MNFLASPSACREHGGCSSQNKTRCCSDGFSLSGNLPQSSSPHTRSVETIQARPRQMLTPATPELNLARSHSLSYTEIHVCQFSYISVRSVLCFHGYGHSAFTFASPKGRINSIFLGAVVTVEAQPAIFGGLKSIVSYSAALMRLKR